MVVCRGNRQGRTHRTHIRRIKAIADGVWIETCSAIIGPQSVACVCAVVASAIASTMSEYQIELALSVTGPDLKEAVMLRNFKEIDGVTFVLLAKSDRAVSRLVMGKSSSNERALAKAGIFQTLIACRNEKTMSAITPAAAEDLGLDDPRPPLKKKKIDKAMFPPFVEIEAPTVATIEGIRMKVLPEVSTQAPLWVGLTPTVVEYLAKVVRHQVKTSSRSTRERKAEVEGVQGVTFEQRRGAYRARRSDGSQKYVSAKSHVDPAAAATEWATGASQDDPSACASEDAHGSQDVGA